MISEMRENDEVWPISREFWCHDPNRYTIDLDGKLNMVYTHSTANCSGGEAYVWDEPF